MAKKLSRSHTVFLALGSNLGDQHDNISKAIEALKTISGTQFIISSPFYRTKPLGGKIQNDYLNAVVKVETELAPLTLLDETQKIEWALGRVRTEDRFASRTLDIDILLYSDWFLESERLTLPHHGLLSREFMLYPLFDIAPTLILPNGQSLAQIIEKTDKNGMVLWDN